MWEVLIGSPSIAFAFGISASQFGAEAPGPSQAARPPSEPSGYGGTGTMTMPASPRGRGAATDVDGSYSVPVARPATLRTHIVAVICRVEAEAGWASLAGMGRVDPFHRDACALRLVGDVGIQLSRMPPAPCRFVTHTRLSGVLA